MNTAVFVLFGLLVVGVVQAKLTKYEFTQTAKNCIKEIGTDEDTVKEKILTETGKVNEDDDIVKKFIGCCYRTFISGTNEVVVDDKFTTYITEIFTKRTDGRTKLSTLLAKVCIEICKDQKGDTEESTAVKVSNCLIRELNDFIKQH